MELKPEYIIYLFLYFILLIVPYGIETGCLMDIAFIINLLIVPYGIETEHSLKKYVKTSTFNRTLWN